MKKYFLFVLSVAVLASCSAPKYAYHFDHYDYNSGRKQTDATAAKATDAPAVESPLALPAGTMVASADEKSVIVAEPAQNLAEQKEAAQKKYAAMSKAEQKAFRKEAKSQIRQYVKAAKSGDKAKMEEASKAMDHDLKLAAIFGAVGLVALLIGGDVFWVLGAIALLVGVVFFVMWLTRQ
jgi:hypothetical protein